MAALASWATPVHASLMASSTMDDYLAVHDMTLQFAQAQSTRSDIH